MELNVVKYSPNNVDLSQGENEKKSSLDPAVIMTGYSSTTASQKSMNGSSGRGGMDNPAFVGDSGTSKTESLAGQNGDGSMDMDMDDHRISLEELLHRYGTNLTRGLTTAQVKVNRERHGENVLTPPKEVPQWVKLLKEFFAGLNILLWACAVLAFGSFSSQYIFTPTDIAPDNCILGVSILLVILVSGLFAYYQEFKSNRIMQSFKNMVPQQTHVYRDGKRLDIAVSELVVGDLVEVRYGDLIPADIRIIESQDFKVDNSGLTGEAEPQKRGILCTHNEPLETRNLAFFSTNAVEGHCKGIVVRVGSNTFMGQLASLASKVDAVRTPIGIEMDLFINIMTIRSILFGGIFFTVAMLMSYDTMDAIFFVIGIVVANVPEGLCVTFTMVLSLTAKRMAQKNCLVKNLQAVETLGSTSVICSDKTGTLTQNKMSVAHLWFNGEIAEADTSEFTVTKSSFHNEDPGFHALTTVASLCSRAIFKPGQEDIPLYNRIVEGDASEAAILKFMESQRENVVKYRNKFPKLVEIPFNSANKYQVSVHDMRNPNDPRPLLVMKGAPERVINFCNRILIGDKEYELDDDKRREFNDVYMQLGVLGERVLGFCDHRLPLEKYPVGYEYDSDNPNFLAEGLRFVGLISMIDPPRSAVPGAVAKCRGAGIKVVMVTGDHPVTAAAIARAVGIFTEGNQTIEEIANERGCSVNDLQPTEATAAVVSGAELKLLTDEQLENVLTNYKEIVFARTSPDQKYRIVESFQNLGHIVASTGDGVNDSPALKKADIGVAMGISGTEVSRETADMILMDDNFATVVTGVEEGRLIFDNLKKLVAYNLADNIAEMYSVWVFIALRCPLPMGTIAMLLSVVGTDVAPAISIAHETAESDIMRLRPRNPRLDKLVTPQLLSYTYGQTSMFELLSGFFTYFVILGMNGWKPWDVIGIRTKWESSARNDLEDSYGQEWTYSARSTLQQTAATAFFCSIVLTQVSNVIVCKTRRMSLLQKGMTNWNMNISILFELALMCFFVYTPYLNGLLLLSPVPYPTFIAPIPFMLLMIIYDEFRRLGIRTSTGWVHSEFYT